MDFSYSDDRRMLSDSLRRYLMDQYPIEQRNMVAIPHRIIHPITGKRLQT